MNKGKLLFVPSGGLANRMRAMASAWQMAQHTGVKVETVWFCDWALNAPFRAIFAPIEHKEMTVREKTQLAHSAAISATLFCATHRRMAGYALKKSRLRL